MTPLWPDPLPGVYLGVPQGEGGPAQRRRCRRDSIRPSQLRLARPKNQWNRFLDWYFLPRVQYVSLVQASTFYFYCRRCCDLVAWIELCTFLYRTREREHKFSQFNWRSRQRQALTSASWCAELRDIPEPRCVWWRWKWWRRVQGGIGRTHLTCFPDAVFQQILLWSMLKHIEIDQMEFSLQIAAVCHEAALSAMQEDRNIENIHKRHFEEALSAVKPRISAELIDFYESYAKNCGLHSL